jgi:glycosyltransferase involved in cell wall biosynthesis
MRRIYFNNSNSESIIKWILRKNDTLEQVVFYFLSQTNITSPRYFPLFNASTKIRIVYLNGLIIPYTDLLMLKLYKLIFNLLKPKFERYNCIHFLGEHPILNIKKQILHIDDPTYSKKEMNHLLNWENLLVTSNLTPIIVTTNVYTQEWLLTYLKSTNVTIIEQGYDLPISQTKLQRFENADFSCVYSSPYIHIGNDKHANHDTWGAELLIEKIIPKINYMISDISIHLVGEIGKDASKELQKHKNIIYHGRVNFAENMSILEGCSIGIYPRNKDLKRSMSKIFSYIGAGLPVVTYDLVDTEVIKRNSLGYSVKSEEEFIEKILYLKNNPDVLQSMSSRVNKIKNNYTWQILSQKMENYLEKF